MRELVGMKRLLAGTGRDVVQLSRFHSDSTFAAKVNLGEVQHPVGKTDLMSKLKENLQLTSLCPSVLTILLCERTFKNVRMERSEVKYHKD